VIYYVVFRFVIRRWNLRTPGREDEELDDTGAAQPAGTDAPAAMSATAEPKAAT
jgi:PTS system N-acetylglucosamine-specific IIC component